MSFYDDQGTHHAAALTYYALMSLFPTLLLAVSLLGPAFSSYLANFKSFNVTYGSFAAAIILLVWLWLTNVALLFGAEVDAEIERAKETSEAMPEQETVNFPMGR